MFYFIPPTEENLLKYEQWVMSSNQSEIFFGDLVPKCWKCHIKAGNTLFIPTGEEGRGGEGSGGRRGMGRGSDGGMGGYNGGREGGREGRRGRQGEEMRVREGRR